MRSLREVSVTGYVLQLDIFKSLLTSKDIDLVLQRRADDPWSWKLIYKIKINQRWVKNNRDPENNW